MREKRTINSFGNITIPKKMRDELGLVDGISTVQIYTRETALGDKEIVIKKLGSYKDIIDRYSTWASVVSRIVSCTVSLVWNNKVLILANYDNSMDLSERKVYISSPLIRFLGSMEDSYAVFRDKVPFLDSGDGIVKSVFKIREEWGAGYFVIMQGTKYDSGEVIPEKDLMNRYHYYFFYLHTNIANIKIVLCFEFL